MSSSSSIPVTLIMSLAVGLEVRLGLGVWLECEGGDCVGG